MLLIIDEENINILNLLNNRIRKTQKNINESEVWIKKLNNLNNLDILDDVANDFHYYNNLLFYNKIANDKNSEL